MLGSSMLPRRYQPCYCNHLGTKLPPSSPEVTVHENSSVPCSAKWRCFNSYQPRKGRSASKHQTQILGHFPHKMFEDTYVPFS